MTTISSSDDLHQEALIKLSETLSDIRSHEGHPEDANDILTALEKLPLSTQKILISQY